VSRSMILLAAHYTARYTFVRLAQPEEESSAPSNHANSNGAHSTAPKRKWPAEHSTHRFPVGILEP
jgi:hypothetical protein